MPYRPRPTRDEMVDDVFVEFVGPSWLASWWPKSLERGVVLSVGEAWVRVAWTGSDNVVDWPIEWLRGVEPATSATTLVDG